MFEHGVCCLCVEQLALYHTEIIINVSTMCWQRNSIMMEAQKLNVNFRSMGGMVCSAKAPPVEAVSPQAEQTLPYHSCQGLQGQDAWSVCWQRSRQIRVTQRYCSTLAHIMCVVRYVAGFVKCALNGKLLSYRNTDWYVKYYTCILLALSHKSTDWCVPIDRCDWYVKCALTGVTDM